MTTKRFKSAKEKREWEEYQQWLTVRKPPKVKPKREPLRLNLGESPRDVSAVQSAKSLSTVHTTDATALRTSPKYSGTLIIGIATTHKSNAVPVLNKDHAVEISSMRR